MAKGLSIHIGLNRVDPHHYQDQHGNPRDGALAACEFDAQDMQALAQSRGFETQLIFSEQATPMSSSSFSSAVVSRNSLGTWALPMSTWARQS